MPAAISVPHCLNDLGISRKTLEELTLKTLYVEGEQPLRHLAKQMKIELGVVQEVFQRLRKEQLCEVTGMVGDVHRIAISSQGRVRALELLSLNQYVGPAPVGWNDYLARVRSQSVRKIEVHRQDLEDAFENLVLDGETITQIGTAITSGKSLFLYGPSGAGKSTIAEALSKVFAKDHVWIPYAIELDGQIITVYDPVIHHALEQSDSEHTDARWILCQRPAVLVGGELTIEMLDLQFNSITKYYSGPIQMKANNGLLIIDDFGRQRLSPDQLLNRWVVPLDRRIDFLTMAGGKKIEIPFDLFVVFATNLDPAKLVDVAFLRRIQTKIRIDTVTPEQFQEIFRRVCSEFGLKFDAELVRNLAEAISSELKEPLRACHPRDIVQQICWAASYQQNQPQITWDTVAQACRNYFLVK
jgi:predicted ATPase with chaperone activity